jgi:hypothetical protein
LVAILHLSLNPAGASRHCARKEGHQLMNWAACPNTERIPIGVHIVTIFTNTVSHLSQRSV